MPYLEKQLPDFQKDKIFALAIGDGCTEEEANDHWQTAKLTMASTADPESKLMARLGIIESRSILIIGQGRKVEMILNDYYPITFKNQLDKLRTAK